MSLDKKDFFGKEVTDAIRDACAALDVAQEQLEIEVVETGSTGIFGLIRKKAHIRVQVKARVEDTVEEILEISGLATDVQAADKGTGKDEGKGKCKREEKRVKAKDKTEKAAEPKSAEIRPKAEVSEEVSVVEVASSESLDLLQQELLNIVDLMGFPSTLKIEAKGLAVKCVLTGEFEEQLTGSEGKTLDSLQYLLRKIISRKVSERLKITVDVGEFRKRRQEELKVRAIELATMVKEDGKTQVIPALNPAERRVVHMTLQDDKEIRSRSVGDGLFKKILIYKPGKGNRGGRKRPQYRGRRGKPTQAKKKPTGETKPVNGNESE